MRTIYTLIVIVFFSCNIAKAQNDTMYIYRLGEIILQQAIADMDSITFAKTTGDNFDVFDNDGNGYHTVTIGTQTWMVENFRGTKFRSGVAIEYVEDAEKWSQATTPMYCWYENDKEANAELYGALYNWYAASDINNLAPAGWRVPKYEDFLGLRATFVAEPPLSLAAVTGRALREAGTEHWNVDVNANNSTGWTALPAGIREELPLGFGYKGDMTMWHCNDPAIPTDPEKVLGGYMDDYGPNGSMTNSEIPKKMGASIRLIKE